MYTVSNGDVTCTLSVMVTSHVHCHSICSHVGRGLGGGGARTWRSDDTEVISGGHHQMSDIEVRHRGQTYIADQTQ